MTRFFFALLLIFSPFALFAQPYACPPCGNACDTMTFSKPGNCPRCRMPLVQKITPMNVCFYLQDGVEVLDFAGPLEVFSYAGCNLSIVSKTKDTLHSMGTLNIIPNYSIEDAPPSDILVFFGGPTSPTTKDPAVMKWIDERKTNTQYFMSVCTGAFILGKAGMLENKTVTTFHRSIENLRKAQPTSKVLSDKRFVEDGNVLTTAGISAGIDGALHLVAKLRGIEVAKQIAAEMEYDKWVPDQGLVIQ